jgi:hypothetical protein
MQAAGVLSDGSSPRHGKRQKQRVQARIVEPFADLLTGGQDGLFLILRDRRQPIGHRLLLLFPSLLVTRRWRIQAKAPSSGWHDRFALSAPVVTARYARESMTSSQMRHCEVIIDQLPDRASGTHPRIRIWRSA